MESDADFIELLRKQAPPPPTEAGGDGTLRRAPQPGLAGGDPVADLLAALPEGVRAAPVQLARLLEEAPAVLTGLGPEPFAGKAAQGVVRAIEAAISEIDRRMTRLLNLVLHHPEFQAMEASWRGLHFLVRQADSNSTLKIKLIDIGKRELGRTLRKFRGAAWDQSPIFKKIYEEEYGQLGGEPFGLLVGDYEFDQRPDDVRILADMAAIAAAAHAPFVASAAPALMQMESWAELATRRDLMRILEMPDYATWRSLRETEDARYLGLVMPRMLARLPYGLDTDPVDDFAFEEDVEGPDARNYPWTSAVFAFAANVARSFALYGWCSRIHGIETGGIVEGLPVLRFPTHDGATDIKCITEIALNERREAELARSGLIPLVHRKNTENAVFISAHSLQKPVEYDDEAASANAVMSARLPYMFASCRFAHYLKCIVRDKVGSAMSHVALQELLNDWLMNYVDGSPSTSSEEWKASHPLEEALALIEEVPDNPGHYEAKFYLRPHYQLEGLTVALRLVSRIPST